MTDTTTPINGERYFPSKRDLGLGLLVWLPGIGILPLLLLVSLREALVLLALIVPTYALVGWLWFGTGYKITGDVLYIYSGPLRRQIYLSDITRVRESRSWTAGAALSFDRLEIRCGKGTFVYISPLDKKGFVSLLRQKCPDADIEVIAD